MKILTNKEYENIANHLVKGGKAITECEKLLNEVDNLNSQVVTLKKELAEAKDLKAILEKLYPLNEFVSNCKSVLGSSVRGGYELSLPDNVLVYVDDILGGKVIKQEGTKALIISKNGEVKTGLTKQKPDKGYSYKLVRE
jgi:hypothetical protein